VAAPRTLSDQMQTFRRADDVSARAISDGLTFGNVRKAIQWYAEARGRISTPSAASPRTARASDGTVVVLDVQGGRPTSRDEVLSTLSTLHSALDAARMHYPEGVDWLLRSHSGETQSDIARTSQKSQPVISVAIGKAEAFLVGRLGAAGVLR
jgi:hypothetical protein